MKHSIFTLTFLFLLTTLLPAQDPGWHQVPGHDFSGTRGEMSRILHETTDENVMLQFWRRPGIDEDTLFLKMLAGKRLGMYGTAASIPVLVPLLENEKEGYFARYALETIPGDEVDVALGAALATMRRPEAIAGVLTTLGVRANPLSATAVKPFLTHADANVRHAAAYAFAATATDEVALVLLRGNVRIPFPVDSAFLLAEQRENRGQPNVAAFIYSAIIAGELRIDETIPASALDRLAREFQGNPPNDFPRGRLVFDTKEFQRLAAVYRKIMALGLSAEGISQLVEQLQPGVSRHRFDVGIKAGQQLPADARATVTRAMLAQLNAQTDPWRKSLLVRAIGSRNDAGSVAISLPVIEALARTGDVVVRVAAIDALRFIGDASVLPVLIESAQSNVEAVAGAAQNTLSRLPGEDFDAALIALLDSETPAIQIIAANIIAERRTFAATPTIIRLLLDADTDATVSGALAATFGEISEINDLPVLLDRLRQATTAAETRGLLVALIAACTRFPQDTATAEVERAMAGADTAFKTHLLDLLRHIAGSRALSIVERFALGNDRAMQDAASRVLGQWGSPQDLDQLAVICRRVALEAEYEGFRIRGFRAYLRLARQFDMPPERRLEMSMWVFEHAERDAEKVLIFDTFDRVVTMESLELTASFLDNPTFAQRAAEVAVNIAYRMPGTNARTNAVMQKVREVSTSAADRERAGRVLERR